MFTYVPLQAQCSAVQLIALLMYNSPVLPPNMADVMEDGV
jgi:hypothetical protein